MDKVVILAAGLGKRMRQLDAPANLTEEQAQVAARGIKALIPIGRPFLDYALTRVADAGYRRVCLVIGPDHDELRAYYSRMQGQKLRIGFAVQAAPQGTADALAAAAEFVDGDPVLVLNSDNYYPTEVMRAMGQAEECAVAGFERQGLLRDGNIPADRLSKFSVLEVDDAGYLKRIIEKPDPSLMEHFPEPVLISMNCWRFGPAILTACRAIGKSPRGEYEIPDAVMYSIKHLGQRYRVFRSGETVLDLSGPEDIESAARRLAHVEVEL